MLYVSDNVLVVHRCNRRDSRGKCLDRGSLVEVLARNGTGTREVESALSSVDFGTCLTPQRIQAELDRSYQKMVKGGEFECFRPLKSFSTLSY